LRKIPTGFYRFWQSVITVDPITALTEHGIHDDVVNPPMGMRHWLLCANRDQEPVNGMEENARFLD